MVNYRKRKIYCDALGSSKTPHISLKVLKSYSLCSLHRDKKTEHLFEIRAVWKTSLVFNVQHCYVINLIVYVMNTEMWMITLVGIKFIVHLVYCSPLSPIQGLNNNFFYSPPMKHIYRFWLGATLFLVQPRHSRLQMNYYYFTFACDKNKKKPTKSLTWKEENIIELQAMHSNRKLSTIRRSTAPDKVNKLKNFLLFFF